MLVDLESSLTDGFFSLITYIQTSLLQINPFCKPNLSEYGETKAVGSSWPSFPTLSNSGSELAALRDPEGRKKKNIRNGQWACCTYS